MLQPEFAHRLDLQMAPRAQAAFGKQLVGPAAQRPAQPGADRDGETRLGPLDQLARNMTIEDLTQGPFAGAVGIFIDSGRRQASSATR